MNQTRFKPYARALFLSGILIGTTIGVIVSKRLFDPVKEEMRAEAVAVEEAQPVKKAKKPRTDVKAKPETLDPELASLEASIDSMAMDSFLFDTGSADEMDSLDAFISWEDTIDIDEGPLDYDDAIDVWGEDEALMKDVLIAVRFIVPDGDKDDFSCESYDEMDSLLVDYASPRNSEKMRVEFWKSPINYKGYILTRNKLALYGIYELNEVHLEYLSDGRMQLDYLGRSYTIRCSDKFVPFH